MVRLYKDAGTPINECSLSTLPGGGTTEKIPWNNWNTLLLGQKTPMTEHHFNVRDVKDGLSS